eukprot:Opistho-2@78942
MRQCHHPHQNDPARNRAWRMTTEHHVPGPRTLLKNSPRNNCASLLTLSRYLDEILPLWPIRKCGLTASQRLSELLKNYETRMKRKQWTEVPCIVPQLACAYEEWAIKLRTFFLKGLELFGALTADPRATKGELTAAADKMLPLLILRTGDITPRTRDAALEAVVQAATRPVLKPVVVTNLIGNPKKPLATRIIRGKLEALEKLLEGGLDEDAGLSVAETMKSLRTMLGHASGEVRDAAVKAVLAMYRVCGPPIESHLKGIRPQLLEALNEGFDAIDGRAKRTKKVLPKKDPEKEKEETVRKLQEQLAELRQLAALAASGKSTVAAKKPNVDAIDEETEPDSTPSSSFKGKKLPAKAPVKASVGTKKSAGFPAAKPKGPVATVRSRSRTASVRSGASSRSSVYSDEDAEEDGRSSVASSVPPKRTAATKLTLQRTTSVTSGRSSVASMRGAKGPPIEKTCIFCAEHNESFTEDALDIHYWKSCPMLTQCMLCKQVSGCVCLAPWIPTCL